jgi:hypothetical protein
MSHRRKWSRLLAMATGLALGVPLAAVAVLAPPAAAASVTTAWQNGSFSLNPNTTYLRMCGLQRRFDLLF